jgi:uncharacterized protein YjbI with pentapeptide repeats
MQRILAAITVAVTLVASSASAFDPADLKKLKEANECERCYFLSANLTGANLSDAELSGITSGLIRITSGPITETPTLPVSYSLVNGYIVGPKVNLAGADLSKAKLTGAKLSEASLRSANLTSATLTNAYLAGAKLSGANLKGANLDYAIMDGAILCNTTMPDGSVIYRGC